MNNYEAIDFGDICFNSEFRFIFLHCVLRIDHYAIILQQQIIPASRLS